jgi:hypothetical protein
MRHVVEFEDIEEMRRQQGIDDVELRDEIRGLRIGDTVKITLLPSPGALVGETVLVRITSIRDSAFRGKLVTSPTSPALASLGVGFPITFTTAHIHSVVKGKPPADLDDRLATSLRRAGPAPSNEGARRKVTAKPSRSNRH